MSIQNKMPTELREHYIEAMPFIDRALEIALPDKCNKEWVDKVVWGVGQNWDLEALQNSIFEPFNYYLKNRGKRLRPFVTYMVLKAFEKNPDHYLPALASSEIIHISSLICDDVADKSKLRRGKPTAHLVYGVPVAINVAFTMVHYAGLLIEQIEFEIPEEIRNQIYSLLNQEVFSSCVGLAADVSWSNNNKRHIPNSKIWQHMINKTCPLTFVVPVMIGVILCSAQKQILTFLREWAIHTGAIYQLVDDMLNLQPLSSEWGKEWAEDLDENKCTLLMSYALQHLNTDEHNRVDQLLSQEGLSNGDKAEIISMIEKTGAFDYIPNQIQLLLNNAIQSLTKTGLPTEKIKPLQLFTEFVARRNF